MANEECNALAELAKVLSWIIDILREEGYDAYCADANKAYRIITELAKVAPMIRRSGKTLMYTPEDRMAVIGAVDYCREIAEEGAKE